MAKISGAKCRLCRRAGTKLFLKGDRCNTAKCAIVKRNYPPGAAGAKGKPRLTTYGSQLREKQKAKQTYGLSEKQFSTYFNKASKRTGNTAELMLQMLETRLDNVIFRLGYTKSRAQARQYVGHGYFKINNRKVDIPSYHVKVGQVITLAPRTDKYKNLENLQIDSAKVPGWLFMDNDKKEGKIVAVPKLEEMTHNFDSKLIIEFYSR